jgi:hypothetical protein
MRKLSVGEQQGRGDPPAFYTKGHRVEEVGPTGREPEMLQDADRGLSKWLASKPDARLHVREAAAAIAREREERTKPSVPTYGKAYALIAALGAVAFAILCLVVIAVTRPPNY